jgi:hypothetical protein
VWIWQQRKGSCTGEHAGIVIDNIYNPNIIIMAWRFRKRIKLIPGIYLNFSKRGISTMIGPRGLSLNVDHGGKYLNVDMTGSGLAVKNSLSGKNDHRQLNTEEIAGKLKYLLEQTYEGTEQFKSEVTSQLTSSGLKNLKETIIAAHTQYADISGSLKTLVDQKNAKNKQLQRAQKSIFRYFLKKKIKRYTEEQFLMQEELNELDEQQRLSTIELQVNNEDDFGEIYEKVKKAYQLIVNCLKTWDITASKQIDRVKQRSAAATEVTRVEVISLFEESGLIVTEDIPLRLQNKNGGDLFFYPGFVIVHEQALDFAILDYSEFDIGFSVTRFIETEQVPTDAEIAGKTWAKVNKDGSPDRRFSNNYQIPIAKYGEITFTSKTGLHEKYLFSNSNYASLFYSAMKEYLTAVKMATQLLNEFDTN